MKKILFKSFFIWLPFAALITFACLLSYLLVQQDLRMTANDPQIEVAEDVAQALGNGISPQDIVPPGQVINIATSLDPFIIIFDALGKVLASSATLNGTTPAVPNGVFASVAQHGEDRITWQPQPGVRSAAVIDSFAGNASSSGGFVLAGRSLREIEIREDNVLHLAMLAWIAGLIAMFAVVWAVVWMYKRKIT
jgi:hypothetical protein